MLFAHPHTLTPQTKARGILYLITLLISFHEYVVAYGNSSFLATFMPEASIGVVFMVGSLLSILSFIAIPDILRRWGNYRVMITCALLELAVFSGIVLFKNPALLTLLIALHLLLCSLLFFGIDVFLESATDTEEHTGKVRGTLLTMSNLALVFSPLIAGMLIGLYGFRITYLVAALFLFPFITLLHTGFRHFQDPVYEPFHLRGVAAIIKNVDVRNIAIASLILQIFFALMVIYMPVYLHVHIGFSWPTIGVLFSIILLPYLAIELPAGKLADERYGEKELLALGFMVCALATGALSFITVPSFLLWTSLLLATRIGGALIESMTETYFFKQVGSGNTDIISVFRIQRPLSYVLAPIIAAVAFYFVSYEHFWLVVSGLLLCGIYFALSIKDTR